MSCLRRGECNTLETFSDGSWCSEKEEHTQWGTKRVTKHNVRWNCVIHVLSSQRQSRSHYYWRATRDGSTIFIQSQWGNNSSCITTARKSLHTMVSLTTHRRTLIKLRGSGIKLPHIVQGKQEWHTQRIITDNESGIYFYEPERESASMVLQGKRRKKHRDKFKNEWSAGQAMLITFWDFGGLVYPEFGPSYLNTLIHLVTEIQSKRWGFC